MAAPAGTTVRAAYAERLGPPEALVAGGLDVAVPGPTGMLLAVGLSARTGDVLPLEAPAEIRVRLEAGTVAGRRPARP
ncbi:MAG: hypothetical protein M0Z42_08535 [Actinomycetota bacterium]|nr:hypothetical protein [Actinomycetota bacterium]